MCPLLLFLSLLCAVDAAVASGGHSSIRRRRLEQVGSDLVCCVITPIQIDFDNTDLEPEVVYDCYLLGDAEGSPYTIEIPEDFESANQNELLSGSSTICIEGGVTAVRSIDGNFINITDDAVLNFVEGGSERDDSLETGLNATREVLIVRVIGDAGGEPPEDSTKDQLATALFGNGNQASNSVFGQFYRCSFGKLNFTAATGYPQISNGVLDLQISDSLARKNVYAIRSMLRAEAGKVLNVSSLTGMFRHVIFCLPSGTNAGGRGWTAFAQIGGPDSYYNAEFERCTTVATLSHELGHNLGLHHSGEDDDQYGDTSGIMGGLNRQLVLKECFNPHKNWLLKWYEDKALDLSLNNTWSGRLVAFVDYEQADTSRGEYVLLRKDDFYFQFNRAKSFNAGTSRSRNKVVLVTPPDEDQFPIYSRHEAALAGRETYPLNSITTLEVCSLVFNDGGMDYADIRIYPTAEESPCPVRPAPENDRCPDALSVPVGTTIAGNTTYATPDEDDIDGDLCSDSVDDESPGVWFTIEGTGRPMTVDTLNPGTTYDTKIAVFSGSCGSLTCVSSNDDVSSSIPQSSLTWSSQALEEYKVLVYGPSLLSGYFVLSVNEVPTEEPSQSPSVSEAPTLAPSFSPTPIPTPSPTSVPTSAPTLMPTNTPSRTPTYARVGPMSDAAKLGRYNNRGNAKR